MGRLAGKENIMMTSGSRISAFIACIALTGAGLVAAASPAQASTLYVWTGEGDGESWSDPDNWNPTGVPDLTTESARIDGASVLVDSDIDVAAITLSSEGELLDGGGSLKSTTFSMTSGRLEVPVTTGAAAFTTAANKEIANGGSVSATLWRGGEVGTISIQLGALFLNADGTPLKASTSITVGARVDGRGADYPTIEIQDTTCSNTMNMICGLLVENASEYGAALEGVTLASSNIVLTTFEPLSMRSGVWRPRNMGKVWTTQSFGRIITGAAYPPGDVASPDHTVVLPNQLHLDNVVWEHESGTVLGGATTSNLTPGTKGGTFHWRGGTVEGHITARSPELNRGISVRLDAPGRDPLEIAGPTGGRAGLTLEGRGSLSSGTVLDLGDSSTLETKSGFTMDGGATITTSSPGSSTAKVVGSAWSIEAAAAGTEPATVEVPFQGNNWTNIRAGATLRLDGNTSSYLKGMVSYIDTATSFGRVEVGEGSSVALSGVLTANINPGGVVEAGDEMLVVESLAEEGEPSGITGGFTSLRKKNLPAGLGLSGELIDVGYVLAIGGAEELALTGSGATSTRIKKAYPVAYTILNKSTTTVAPQLNLPTLKGATISTPAGLTCRKSGAGTACELADLAAGATTTVTVNFTFSKPGKQIISTTVTSPGYNPNPAGATSTLKVRVTR